MILQSLYNYYQRKSALGEDKIAPIGFENVAIPFIIILDKEGKFIDIQDTRELDGKKKIAKKFLVPHSVKKAAKIIPNLLWDHSTYIFGLDKKNNEKKALQRKLSFQNKITSVFTDHPSDSGIKAILSFLQNRHLDAIHKHPLWLEISNPSSAIAFQLLGDTELICRRDIVKEYISAQNKSQEKNEHVCLITGEHGEIARLHPYIKGLAYAQPAGGNIVSYNFDAACSYHKPQGDNAPLSISSAEAYTTALNQMLEKNSHQKMLLGETTTVFWAAKQDNMESILSELFGNTFVKKDDPAYKVKVIEELYKKPLTGAGYITDDNKTQFFILAISPNVSRIAIRFWQVTTVDKLAKNIRQHFDDIQIVHSPKQPQFLTLYQLISATALQDKIDNAPPNLIGETMQSIINGSQYPQTLLQATLRRIRAAHTNDPKYPEHKVNYARAALLKAFLNRSIRKSKSSEKEITMSLDKSNHNIGYQLGRLFAVLEKTQAEALGEINASIRDRYYGAASSTPLVVFCNLMKLNNHHLSKLTNPGREVNLTKLIGEIVNNFDDFPAVLSLPDQGRFAIGYYHQLQDFYTKHEPKVKGV